jgi:hypothetical protein
VTAISVPLSEPLRTAAAASAARRGVTLERFAELAIREVLAEEEEEDRLRERFRKATRDKFEAVLAKVPDVPPMAGDELP